MDVSAVGWILENSILTSCWCLSNHHLPSDVYVIVSTRALSYLQSPDALRLCLSRDLPLKKKWRRNLYFFGYRALSWRFNYYFYFITLYISSHFLLAYKISSEKFYVLLTGTSLNIVCIIFLIAFRIFSLSLFFDSLTITCLCIVLFRLNLIGGFWPFYTCTIYIPLQNLESFLLLFL